MKIYMPMELREGCDRITFKEPLVFDCFYVEDDERYAVITFPSGMEKRVGLTFETNCILQDYEKESIEQKICRDVTFDIFHAFFHCPEDPNYTYYHWALYFMLKDNIKCWEVNEGA